MIMNEQKKKTMIMNGQVLLSFSYCRHEMGFLVLILGLSLEMFACVGGYKGKKDGHSIPAGTDIFLSVSRTTSITFVLCSCFSAFHHVHIFSINLHPFQVYNLHRSPYFWDRPHEFEPERFQVPRNSDIEGWSGFDPSRSPGALYPNEVTTNHSFFHLILMFITLL